MEKQKILILNNSYKHICTEFLYTVNLTSKWSNNETICRSVYQNLTEKNWVKRIGYELPEQGFRMEQLLQRWITKKIKRMNLENFDFYDQLVDFYINNPNVE